MNIDSGQIVHWNDLTDEQKESGRWVKLTDDEHSIALTIEEHERRKKLHEIFGTTNYTGDEGNPRCAP